MEESSVEIMLGFNKEKGMEDLGIEPIPLLGGVAYFFW
jgi:hypothetical protein